MDDYTTPDGRARLRELSGKVMQLPWRVIQSPAEYIAAVAGAVPALLEALEAAESGRDGLAAKLVRDGRLDAAARCHAALTAAGVPDGNDADGWPGLDERVTGVIAERDTLRRRVATLEAALEPFAQQAEAKDAIRPEVPDSLILVRAGDTLGPNWLITLGDCRRAADLLREGGSR